MKEAGNGQRILESKQQLKRTIRLSRDRYERVIQHLND